MRKVAFLIGFLLTGAVHSDTITLVNGNKIVGKVVDEHSKDKTHVKVLFKNGWTLIRKGQVANVKKEEKKSDQIRD